MAKNLDILYTADHELMAAWSVGVSSAAFPPSRVPFLPMGVSWPACPSAADPRPRCEAATFSVNIGTWPACSYRVTPTTRRMLTDGEIEDSGTNLVTFCKK
jgi:hypothetical protein